MNERLSTNQAPSSLAVLARSRGMRSGIKALLDEAVQAGELLRTDTDSLARAVPGDDARVAAAVGD